MEPQLRPNTLLAFSDDGFAPPTPAEIQTTLKSGNLTAEQAGHLLGVTGGAIGEWIDGEQEMPYAAWRLLLIHLGLVDPPAVESERKGLGGLLSDANPRKRRTRARVGGTSQSNFMKPRR